MADEGENKKTLDPRLIAEWHPTLNGDLRPSDVTPHSHKKVWWRCENGHEWEAIVKNRAYGAGCPVCSGRVASDENNLEVLYPDLAKEWHPTLNGDLRPSDVTPHSHKKVWWRCEGGHEWGAIVKNRAYGAGCPVCSGRIASDENNLEVLYPDLAKEWHPKLNGDLNPSDVTPHSHKKAWWRCERGHEWEAIVKNRAYGAECPVCSGRVASDEKRLVAVPELEEISDRGLQTADGSVHTEIQWLLLKMGGDMGYRLWVAKNDRGGQWQGNRFIDLPTLQEKLILEFPPPTKRIIEYMDVLWLDEYQIVAAFEIELTTPIYSGINRMSDLIAAHPSLLIPLYIVAPDERRDKVVAEINRPAFARLPKPLSGVCRYIAFSRLKELFQKHERMLSWLKADFIASDEVSESCEREKSK